MADSNITKSALASALKELMETTPFAKITVSDICAKCNMNRKSFYYHFKDKFDLVNWIYDVVNFFCDAVICAFGRWISQKEPMPPKEFVNMMKSCIKVVAITQERMENE